MMESVLNVNIFLSPWTEFRSRDYSKETSLEVLLHRTQWRTQGRVPGVRSPPPSPTILYFSTFLLFHFSELIERVISCLIQTLPVTEEEMVYNATSHAEVNKASLEEVCIFLSNIKACAGFDRRLNLVVLVSM